MLAAAVLLLSASPLGTAMGSGPLGLTCSWGDTDTPTKDMTELTLGYIYGYAEARGNRTLWQDQVKLTEQINALCRRRPKTLLKDIAWEILRQRGITTAPTNGKR